ncbi:MAG: hypothetical protein EVG15_09755 [Candidatus Acididesulfobacter diazotrophicus]|jgi:ribosomal protein S17E|uniref:Dynamin N-terminal domain-containing protein n=1 Tax=Candidatus Acididesulfobacter diazotrophicus TaxID=2597226 RepID=A0A519BK93_9DELT|nr:MAG: hypothetical protein EVG15_09755 [Candidatus Acididesulfobacter diazotrophicus]
MMDELIELFNNADTKYSDVISQHFHGVWEYLKNDITSFSKNYKEKLNEARKLRIGIVGQIKAGKSTFLNCLLFEGKDILPKAVTPMTASLTHLSYADKPYAEVEFFDENDIDEIKREAERSSDTTYKKILQDIEEPDIKDLILRKTKSLDFSDIYNLKENLKDYISESGRYTNLIKSVSVYLNYEPIRFIEIIDTPGFNDPVVSRSRKTQKFVETCDILLLLSRASQFLEISDMNLLSQIYNKKSARIYAIASKFDSVLDDAVSTKKDLNLEFKDLFQIELDKRKKEFQSLLNNYRNSGTLEDDVIEKELLYFSSAFHKKNNNIPLNDDEERPIKKLSERTNNFSINSSISGFDLIKKIIDGYKDEKQTNAAKSKIIEEYTKNRTKSLKESIAGFIENVSELLNKKTAAIKGELFGLENKMENFSRDKDKIQSRIMQTYVEYSVRFSTEMNNLRNEIVTNFSIDRLKESSAKTNFTNTIKKIEKRDWMSAIFRFFGSTDWWGYEEIPVKTPYKYFDRDLIINMIDGIINSTNKRINIQIKKIFNIDEIKQKIIDILRESSLPGSLTNQAINISVKTPESININPDVVNRLFYKINAYQTEIADDSLFETIKTAAISIIEFIEKDIDNLKRSIEEQTKNQINKITGIIENHFMQNIKSLTKLGTLKEEEVKILNNKLSDLIKDLEKIKRIEILNNK